MSFFDVEHEVKKDWLVFRFCRNRYLKKNNVHNNFFRNLTSKSSRSIFSSPRLSRVNGINKGSKIRGHGLQGRAFTFSHISHIYVPFVTTGSRVQTVHWSMVLARFHPAGCIWCCVCLFCNSVFLNSILNVTVSTDHLYLPNMVFLVSILCPPHNLQLPTFRETLCLSTLSRTHISFFLYQELDQVPREESAVSSTHPPLWEKEEATGKLEISAKYLNITLKYSLLAEEFPFHHYLRWGGGGRGWRHFSAYHREWFGALSESTIDNEIWLCYLVYIYFNGKLSVGMCKSILNIRPLWK
jgi:hypothetical protein